MNNEKLAEELVKLAEEIIEGRIEKSGSEPTKNIVYDDGEYYVEDLRDLGYGVRVNSRTSTHIVAQYRKDGYLQITVEGGIGEAETVFEVLKKGVHAIQERK